MIDRFKIDIRCEHYTDYAWVCYCQKKNLEIEGQLYLEDGEYVFCSFCNKSFIFNKKYLKLIKQEKE